MSEVGLPEGRIPLALLFFNLGVESGQLIFVSGVLGFIWALRSAAASLPRWTALVTPYAVGIIAMFWFFERVAAF